MKIPENIYLQKNLLLIEDDNGVMYKYRMRCVRTELKRKMHNLKEVFGFL